jgi:hypothetical protein
MHRTLAALAARCCTSETEQREMERLVRKVCNDVEVGPSIVVL